MATIRSTTKRCTETDKENLSPALSNRSGEVFKLTSMSKIGKIIELPKRLDHRGNLTVAEEMKDIPFNISRVYWVYDVPGGENRGGHSHKHCREFIIAANGSFTVTLDNGTEKESFLLNHPYQGLLVNTDTWRTLEDFSSGAVCLVLAEDPFDEDDYIREYDEYLKFIGKTK